MRAPGEVDQTLYKSLRVLEAVAQATESCGVTELADLLGMTKSNVHRVLRGLVLMGYLRPAQERGRYEITSKLWELGLNFFAKLDIRRVCTPYMTKIAAMTQETVLLSVLEGSEAVFVAITDSPQTVRAYTAVGERLPAQYVASGRVQLAWSDEATIQQAAAGLQAHTQRSILDPQAFRELLRDVKAKGYAISDGEWVENANSVATPVFNAEGEVVAGIGVAGPADRLDVATCVKHSKMMIEISQEISQQLGYRPSLTVT